MKRAGRARVGAYGTHSVHRLTGVDGSRHQHQTNDGSRLITVRKDRHCRAGRYWLQTMTLSLMRNQRPLDVGARKADVSSLRSPSRPHEVDMDVHRFIEPLRTAARKPLYMRSARSRSSSICVGSFIAKSSSA